MYSFVHSYFRPLNLANSGEVQLESDKFAVNGELGDQAFNFRVGWVLTL